MSHRDLTGCLYCKGYTCIYPVPSGARGVIPSSHTPALGTRQR